MAFSSNETLETQSIPDWLRPPSLYDIKETMRAVKRGETPILNFQNDICNANCMMCDAAIRRRSGQSAPPNQELLSAILAQMKDNNGLQAVEFCGNGEPDLPSIRTITDMGLDLAFFTNATYIDEEVAEELVRNDHVKIVKFKLETTNPEITAPLIGGQSLAKKNMEGIFNLIGARYLATETNTIFAASIVITNQTLPDINDIENSPFADNVRFCLANQIVPQINFVELLGENADAQLSIEESVIPEIHRFVQELVKEYTSAETNLNQFAGEMCAAFAAPILEINGKKAQIKAGYLGLGCEYPLRRLHDEAATQKLTEPFTQAINTETSIPTALDMLQAHRKNLLHEIAAELELVATNNSPYDISGTDASLAGCGLTPEEEFLVLYAMTMYANDDYFKTFVENYTYNPTQKRIPAEIQGLISNLI